MSIICPLCSGDKIVEFQNQLRYNHTGKIHKCEDCSFIFLYPRLSEEDQKNYYETEYRDDYQDNSVEQRFNSDVSEAKQRLNRIRKQCPQAESILEIGSGSGAFLSLATQNFKKAVGIELDVSTQKFLKDKNLEVYSDLQLIKDEKFDLIVMFHVLEHLLNPVMFLNSLEKHLKNDGCIVVEVPNVEDALLDFYNIKEFKDFYFCTAHVSYFSEKTLRDCFKRAGFEGDVLPVQRYDLNNHIHWLIKKEPGMLIKEKQILSKETLENYEKDLFSKGLSDTLWAVIKK